MNKILVCGWGAVSPAGWGVPALRAALERDEPIAPKQLACPGLARPLWVREVPPPTARPSFLAHPRLRRSSLITHYAAGAMLEALESAGVAGRGQPRRLGLIVCLCSGCLHYSYRFFDETLKDPATASPLLFPETVFNAPASHLAALLGEAPTVYTLLGDSAMFLMGVALAADWLLEARVDGCLVIGAEETVWVLAEVLWYFDHGAVSSGGAGALYFARHGQGPLSVELDTITVPQLYSSRRGRAEAARLMRAALPRCVPGELLCDGTQNRPRADRAERAAWSDWTAARISPKNVLGEGLMAAGAWQCVAACDALAQGRYQAADVSIVGVDQQAIGARFVRGRH